MERAGSIENRFPQAGDGILVKGSNGKRTESSQEGGETEKNGWHEGKGLP